MALGMIDQSTRNQIKKGDSVFIYQSYPICKIILETIVIDDNVLKENLINDDQFFIDEKSKKEFNKKSNLMRHIRLQLVKNLNQDVNSKLTLEYLRKNGYRGKMQGAIRLDKNPQLFNYIESVVAKKPNLN